AEVGCVAGRKAAVKRTAGAAQGNGIVRKRAAGESAGAAEGDFAAAAGTAGRTGPGDGARAGRRDVFRGARARYGKRSGAGLGYGIVFDAGDRADRYVCVR